MTAEQVLEKLTDVRRYDNAGGFWMAKCPSHNDNVRSLQIDEKETANGRKRIWLVCHAGCRSEDVLRELGLTARDLTVKS